MRTLLRRGRAVLASMCVAVVVALASACSSSSSPPQPQGPFTPAGSANYVGEVTTTTFFTYMGWTGTMSLSAVNVSTSEVSQSQLSGHAWMILAIGTAGVSGSSSSQEVTFYQIALTNPQGETVQLKLPVDMFAFYQKANVTASATLEFDQTSYYDKENSGGGSIFTVGKDPNADDDQDDPATDFTTLSTAQLIQKYAKQIDVTLTPTQFTQLNTPGINAVQLSG
jgi:hypothetical protein